MTRHSTFIPLILIFALSACVTPSDPKPKPHTPIRTFVSDPTGTAPGCWISETLNDGTKIWFARLCEVETTRDFIKSLQRALEARGLYAGPITGEYDAPTFQAVRLYQQSLGLDSAILSLEAGQRLGLVRADLT